MADDPLSFLSNEHPAEEMQYVPEEEPQEQPSEEEAPEQPSEGQRPRDEQGRFAKGETKEGAPPAPDDKQQHIPLTALLDEREKRQKLERELEQYRQQAQRQRPAEAQRIPSVLEDEAAYTQHVESLVQQSVMNERLNLSEEMARDKYGNEEVDAALDMVKTNPRLAQQFMQTRHPYKGLVEYHRQQKLMAEIGTDPAAYRARVEAEIRAQMEAQSAPAQASRPKPPPSSLAAASSVGSKDTETIANGFDRAFPV